MSGYSNSAFLKLRGVKIPMDFLWACGVTAAALVLETSGAIRGGAIPSMPTNLWPNRQPAKSLRFQRGVPGAAPGWATISRRYLLAVRKTDSQSVNAGAAPATASISWPSGWNSRHGGLKSHCRKASRCKSGDGYQFCRDDGIVDMANLKSAAKA